MELHSYLCGILTTLAGLICVFFARYYILTRDRFFVFLAVTFAALAVNWASMATLQEEGNEAVFYLPRLFAFLILLAGIADKNRGRTPPRP